MCALARIYTILHWITVLMENRTFDIQTDFAKEAIAYLKDNYYVPYDEADIIIGYRADDSYFSHASDFINNIISLQTLARAMKLGKLGLQLVLKSEKAFSKIKYEGAEEAVFTTWYSCKKERDRLARKAYQELRRKPWSRGSVYMLELLQQEVKPNDERLRL